ncbi:uncharacterized protein LOC105430489 [Pogonomyrmex barbatus]|uniref:Uncharacterized protein LOC105430489 n=1 Tax=Pogonomyrmex barbatus TaxID=144034 RepID=A0A6I9XBY6_9HYME|nr:uncharacterized protein LOC105430489 [Pogonomyrmex barbatus]
MDTIKHSGYADFEWAVKLNRYSLEFIGLWPKMEETAREKLTANIRVFLLIIMVGFVCVIPCIHSLIRVWGDLMSMTDNLQFTLPLVSMIMKLIIMWSKKADVIMDHIRLIRCVKIIEGTFTFMLLGLFLYFGTLFSLYGFLLVTIITDGRHLSFVRLSFLVTVIVNIFAHMCLYCVVGECLIIQCEGIYQAACEYCWYELKPKQAKNLILLMIHSNNPLYITVGKIFPLTMNTFCNLLKTSGGYISVLLARHD